MNMNIQFFGGRGSNSNNSIQRQNAKVQKIINSLTSRKAAEQKRNDATIEKLGKAAASGKISIDQYFKKINSEIERHKTVIYKLQKEQRERLGDKYGIFLSL